MDMNDGMKIEWDKVMDGLHKMQDMVKDMPMEGMEAIKMEWDKMMESAMKVDEMMKMKKEEM